jgi:hypothetical protein
MAMAICLAGCGIAAHRSDYFGEADAALSVLRQWLDAERLVCVPRDPSDAMAEAGWSVRGTQFEPTPDAQEIYRVMIAAAPDALNASDGAPPSPGAITGIRKAADPCSDCIDGWCQMNCGPRVA